jgi:biuret amidohydrolase
VHVAGSDPYPWPYDGRIDPSTLALVLAGWDETWLDRSLDLAAARACCTSLALAVRGLGGAVIGISHRGAVPLPLPSAGVLATADGLDALHGGPLDGLLRRTGRTHLLVAGLGLEGPVHSTLRSANDRGYECLLVTDACAPLTTDLAEASARTVTMSGGIFGAVGTTGAVLDALHALDHLPTTASGALP